MSRAGWLLPLAAGLLGACASPLGRAAAAGDVPQLKKLVDAGAPLDAADADARTPLMRAAEAGQAEAITALCAAGADPNAGTRSGTPLETAALYGQLPAARALLACGAKPTPAPSRSPRTPATRRSPPPSAAP